MSSAERTPASALPWCTEGLLANALPWLPRGVRVGPFRGPPLLTARPRSLLRPMLPSAMLPRPLGPLPRGADGPGPQVSTSGRSPPAIQLSDQRAAKRLREDGDARHRALCILAYVLERYGIHFKLRERMAAGDERCEPTALSLLAAVAARKVATLTKRAGAVRQFVKWFEASEIQIADFVAESTVYAYLQFLLAEQAGGTSGLSACQALNFLSGVFEAPQILDATRSPRVKGLVVLLLRGRVPRGQRAPLTVSMVAHLEDLAETAADDVKAVIAGAALFAIYARLRIGDLRRSVTEPFIDAVEGTDVGFLEGAFCEHKTAAAGSRKILPIVAPLVGVSGRPWARAWMARRAALNLHTSRVGSLLPAPAVGGGWVAAPLKTAEFGILVRGLLRDTGFDADVLKTIGSHSLKATGLSWVGKAHIDRDDRRALGYHVRPGDRSMESYSRDSMAGPLRCFTAVIEDIRKGVFVPDASRSGHYPARQQPPLPPAPPSSTCSSSGSSGSSLAGSDAAVKDEVLVAAADIVVPVIGKYVINTATGFVHFCHLKGKGLACGKPMPHKFSAVAEVPDSCRRCSRCF